MPGRLYLVPNLLGAIAAERVLPQHTIAIARTLAHYVVENAKPARAFLKSISPERAIAAIEIREIGDDPSPAHCLALLAPAAGGQDIGLLSDAGCPGIADPGAALVAAAHRAGIEVVPLVGPSAILLAVMACGMSGQNFAFRGYLPIRLEARASALRKLEEAVARTGATQVLIETPYRNAALVAAVVEHCRGTTQFAIAADLTLPTQWIASRPVSAWRRAPPPILARRPAIFLLGRAADAAVGPTSLRRPGNP